MPDQRCPTCGTQVPEVAAFCPQCGARTGQGDSRVHPDEHGTDVPSRLARALGAKYEVRRMLGEGGFAQVYEVWDTDLQRSLAVKVLKPDIAWSAGMLERFRQECRAIARLNHPNILAIHFVGEGEGLVYYAMPFVAGESLSGLLRRDGALPVDRALAIMKPLLDALSHAHGQGLIHRDIKPDNIMLEAGTGRPLLVDFGIAKRLDGAGHQTQTGFVVGTPQYMSPEQVLGQGDVDARSDLYAVGAVLYQMVTGVPPFEGESSQEVVGKHLSEPAPVATARNARIPMWLSDIIVRCLAKRPAERFQSAAMLIDALTVGRQSGSQEQVSAERVVRRVESEKAAQLATAASSPTMPMPVSGAAGQSRGGGPLLLALVLLAVLAGWILLRSGPRLVVRNQLVEPVRLVLENQTVEIAPGSMVRKKVARSRPLVAHWYLVRPLGPGDAPLGIEVQGTISEERPRGTLRRLITAATADRPVFAPLITNTSAEAVGITVNAGTADAVSCPCRVNPGAVRARIGYYPLYRNSSVRAAISGGRSATFQDLGGNVDQVSGAIGLRFEAKDFRPTGSP